MKIVPKLTFCASPQRPTTAWLVLGPVPTEWVAEMASWGVPLHGVVLHPLSKTGHADGRPIGALVRGELDWRKLRPGRAVAYGQLAPHVLAPVDAACDPPLDQDALERLFPDKDRLLIWNPGEGVFRVDQGGLRLTDLFQPPNLLEREWNAARPGIAVNQRLY